MALKSLDATCLELFQLSPEEQEHLPLGVHGEEC